MFTGELVVLGELSGSLNLNSTLINIYGKVNVTGSVPNDVSTINNFGILSFQNPVNLSVEINNYGDLNFQDDAL